MKTKFEVIDAFSHRPALSSVALTALQAALDALYPQFHINPAKAAVTRSLPSGKSTTETLIDYLRQSFATGKTPRWKTGQNSLVADQGLLDAVAIDVNVEQLAVVVDGVALGLVGQLMQSVVDFWDRSTQNGSTPWKMLALALEQQAISSRETPVGANPVDFERQALDALESQLHEIQDILALGLGDFDEIERCVAKITDISPLLEDDRSAKVLRQLSHLDQLPAWLRNASAVDRLDYSRRLAALAVAGARAVGLSWNDDLPPILEYANTALQDRLLAEHPEAAGLILSDITVHIAKVVAAAVPSGGQVLSIGSVENLKMSVAAFALENLASLPNGTLTLSTRDGGPLPAWLTPDYLKHLVSEVDVGRRYPDLVRRYLIVDASQVARRQALFADQLRVQLPLKALEQKLRGQGNVTQAGYERVRALLQPSATTPSSSLRPLGFVAQRGAKPDVVGNMFVLGSLDPAVGPVVLYRPFEPVPLTEFATWSSLREAICQAGELQEAVLTWMSEHARQRYANGGFDQPHLIRFGHGSDFAPLETPAPAQMDVTPIDGDVFAALFSANARALADLAERESVSNAESRWTLIKQGGWLALDAVMPFISGSVGSALWLVQLMINVDQVLAAESRKAGPEGTEAWNELLLTISMILLHQGFTPRLALSRRPATLKRPPAQKASHPELAGTQTSDSPSVTASSSGATLLDFSWSSANHRLTQGQARALERMKVSPQPPLGAKSAEPETEGLYRLNHQLFVRLDTDLYQVVLTDEGVFVVNDQDPLSGGPRLRRIGQAWELDLSLGLRGGAPKRNLRQLAQENAATLKRVTEAKAVLEQRKNELYRKFVEWDLAFRTAPEQLPSDLISLAEADLNEVSAIVEQKKQLDLSLRPADRPADKTVAKELQGVCRRIAFFEGVLLETVYKVARTQMAQLQRVSEASVTPDNVADYLKLFDDLLVLQSQGVHWSGVREGLWRELRAVPKVGEGFWREGVLELQQSNLFSHLEWRINRLWSLLELSFGEDEILSGQDARELKGLRTDERLHAAFSSQAELEKPNDYTLSEQIGVLESSLREYDRGSLIAMCAHESAPEAVILVQFSRFLEDLSWISDRAEKRLSDLIRESAEPAELPFDYAPKLRQPRKRVFKTRAQRTLIGRLREGESDLPGAMVDVTDAMNDNVIGTYHLHENGEWVEVEVVGPARPAPRENIVALTELKRQAAAALERVEPDISSIRRQSARISEPEDMQDILVQRANKLSALAEKLAAHLTDTPPSESAVSAISTLISELRSGAARLVEEGRTVRVAMIKRLPPTAARLSYLAREREVNIARFDGRKNMSGARRNDFLQEYVIRDREQQVLWWAHFHYASEGAEPQAFVAAHLKMPEQRFIGYKALVKAAKDSSEVVTIYRSLIGKDTAQRLFPGIVPLVN